MESTVSKSITFFPPLKNCKNKFQLSNSVPVVIENNISKEKDLLELSLDKFSILTKQPKHVEKMKFSSYNESNKSNRDKTNAQATPINFKWDTNEMPKLKLNKMKKLPTSSVEKPDEKRMRLQFEQKIAIEQKYFEKAIRNLRSQQFLSHSNETLKKIQENSRKSSEILKTDRWSSTDWKDIYLKNQIIDQFYNYDHRNRRYFRQYRSDYYSFTPNCNYENLLTMSLDFEENNNFDKTQVA